MKKIITLLLSSILLLLPFSGCKEEGLKTINLNEVTHSVFYAPLYVAIENGYFEEEGIKINLTNGGGANNSMTAILSGDAQIGLMGPETVIYVANQQRKDLPKVFGQLTKRDGSFLVSREKEENFKWENLRGKEILAGRKGGVPAMTFEYLLNSKNMYDGVDFTLNYDVQFNLMTSAFLSGTADYCTVFEPTASEYEKEGKWHIVASVGEGAGEIPYTSFIALDSYIKNNEDIIKNFLKALKKAFEYIDSHTEYQVAESIVKQFPSTTISSIETSLINYKKIDSWQRNMQGTEGSFDTLQSVMKNAGELEKEVPFNQLVENKYAKEIFG